MKAIKTSLISIPVLALLLTVGAVDEAQARIRVRGTLKTPRVTVQVDNGAFHHTRGYRPTTPARRQGYFEVTKRDKKMARRLARYTGVPKRELIQLKREGYSWREIGRWIGVSRKAVRAARSQAGWRHFLDRQRHGRFCEVGGYYND